MEERYYTVERIDGDYAHLRRIDLNSEDLVLVARALLPDAIDEGSKLRWELFQYELVE